MSFLRDGVVLRPIETDWFPGYVAQIFPDRVEQKPAMLLQIEGGPRSGHFVALTSRINISLATQFAENGLASSIVHFVRNTTESYTGNDQDLLPIAMAVVEVNNT
ncbi:hypothetical protein NBRC116588_31620 [Pyruvatibacter sp. HU-CL02332]|uniref:hypothetical protein n=1 Tax=Pyruvatibacter sp. HU-CL02332 TaxID=3127650 RepID=UPI0031046C0A